MNLVFDLGNSYGKIAVCEGNRVVEASTYEKITSREIAYYHTRYAGLKGAIGTARLSSFSASSYLKSSRSFVHLASMDSNSSFMY